MLCYIYGFIDKNIFFDFFADMRNKIKNNENIDPYFYKIEKTLKNMRPYE